MIYNEKVEIPGYTAVYSHRIGNKRGGGVATLLKNNIKFDKIQKIQIEKHEIIKIDLHFQEKIIHLVNCYIPPQAILNIEILELLSLPNTLFIGDFNAKNTLWEARKQKPEDKK